MASPRIVAGRTVTAGPFSSAVPRSSDVIAQESFLWVLYSFQKLNVLLQLTMPNYIPIYIYILQMMSDHDRIQLFHQSYTEICHTRSLVELQW